MDFRGGRIARDSNEGFMAGNQQDIARHEGPLILASGSPRRYELMREHGYDVTVVLPPLPEPKHLEAHLSPAQLAEALSYFKASSVSATLDRGVILGGDTVVSLGDRVFGKPVDRDDARAIIMSLAGTTHNVITGVTLLDAQSHARLIRHDSTAVTMKLLTDKEVEAYLGTGAWAGKAGAYGIQDYGDAFVTSLNGSFTNVVGFPMELVSRMLAEWGIHPPIS